MFLFLKLKSRSTILFIVVFTSIGFQSIIFSQTVFDSPKSLCIKNNTIPVKGIYWELPLLGVDSLILNSDRLIVIGSCELSHGVFGSCQVSRSIPSELKAISIVPENHSEWNESDVITVDMSDAVWNRTIENMNTRDKFTFEDSFRSYYTIRKFYHGEGDTTILVFASGKLKQDAKTWMGYILITR